MEWLGNGSGTARSSRRRWRWRRGEATIAELVSKHGLHQTPINAWKRQAIEGMAGVFSGKAEVAAAEREGEVEKLHAKIGQLVVERDFLAKASGR